MAEHRQLSELEQELIRQGGAAYRRWRSTMKFDAKNARFETLVAAVEKSVSRRRTPRPPPKRGARATKFVLFSAVAWLGGRVSVHWGLTLPLVERVLATIQR